MSLVKYRGSSYGNVIKSIGAGVVSKLARSLGNRAVDAAADYAVTKMSSSKKVVRRKRARKGKGKKMVKYVRKSKSTKQIVKAIRNYDKPLGRHVMITGVTKGLEPYYCTRTAIYNDQDDFPFELNCQYYTQAAGRCFKGRAAVTDCNNLTDKFPINVPINVVKSSITCKLYNTTQHHITGDVVYFYCHSNTDSTFFDRWDLGYNNIDYGVGGTQAGGVGVARVQDLGASPRDVKIEDYYYKVQKFRIPAGGYKSFFLKGRTGEFVPNFYTKTGSTVATPLLFKHQAGWTIGMMFIVDPHPKLVVDRTNDKFINKFGRPKLALDTYNCPPFIIETVRHMLVSAPAQTAEAEMNYTKRIDYFPTLPEENTFATRAGTNFFPLARQEVN